MMAVGRLGMMCVASVAALALALSASAAAAGGTPEWYECVKQAGDSYKKFCGAEGGKGGYVARPGTGNGVWKAGSAATTLGGPRNSITCGATISGTKQMPDLLTGVTITLTACHRNGHAKYHCASQEEIGGPKESTIESEPLEGELGYISRSPLRVGLRLSTAAHPGGPVFPRIYCIGPAEHFRVSAGSFVAQIGGAVNVSSQKGTLSYVPGPYLGEGQPPVDPPLEGEEAGTLVEELQLGAEQWGEPLSAAVSGALKVTGTQMIKA